MDFFVWRREGFFHYTRNNPSLIRKLFFQTWNKEWRGWGIWSQFGGCKGMKLATTATRKKQERDECAFFCTHIKRFFVANFLAPVPIHMCLSFLRGVQLCRSCRFYLTKIFGIFFWLPFLAVLERDNDCFPLSCGTSLIQSVALSL